MQGIAGPGLLAAPSSLFAFDTDDPPAQTAERPEPGRGVFFDHHIDLREPEGSKLTDWLVECFDRVRGRQRLRDRKTWRLRLRKLAANAMRGHFFRDPPSILYFRGATADWYQDKPSWMRHGALADAVDPLIKAGVLDGITGKKMPHGLVRPSWTASYWATSYLIETALKCGVTRASIVPDIPQEDLVQLFAAKPKPKYDRLKGGLVQPRKGTRIWLDPTPEVQEWTATLAAINAFYRQQRIELDPGILDSWLTERNADPDRQGPVLRLPELFGTDLYRVFNDCSEVDPKFDRGGRLFGGWWMYVSEEARQAITINGQPTIELDYANCHPRMLYHERDLPGDGDLYTVPEIAEYEVASEVTRGFYRPCIKWLVQILINGRGRPEAVEPPSNMAFPRDISIKEMVCFIEAMHQPIFNSFRTGAGLRLMRLESDIALEILATATGEGRTVLSVHDSFVTTMDQQDWMRAMMVDAYARRLGREPVIKG